MNARYSQVGATESTASLAAELLQQRNDGKNANRLDDDNQRSGDVGPQQDCRAEPEGQRDEIDQRYRPTLRQAETHEPMGKVVHIANVNWLTAPDSNPHHHDQIKQRYRQHEKWNEHRQMS